MEKTGGLGFWPINGQPLKQVRSQRGMAVEYSINDDLHESKYLTAHG